MEKSHDWIDAPADLLNDAWAHACRKAESIGQPELTLEMFGEEVAKRCHPRGGEPQ